MMKHSLVSSSWRDFSTAEASFFFKNSSLLLAFRLNVEEVGFFFFLVGEDNAPWIPQEVVPNSQLLVPGLKT